VIKLSILWDEKRLTTNNSEEVLKEMASIYSEFQKELATTSVSNAGSIFIGLATESDSELIKNLFNLPSELRSRLFDYIQTYFKTGKLEAIKESTVIEDENAVRNEKIKNLLLASPHKDIEILIERPIETGRDIQI